MNKIKRSSGQYSRSRRTGASRSGGMLILVLVIMGVGFILITSALSITIASRNRFYNDAQRSQARLTVTSAAQSVVDAILITQEITDTRIEAWATAEETLPIKSAAGYGFNDEAVSQYSVAPAIGDASADANTSVKFGKLGTQITMDFETKIDAGLNGGSTEKLRVVLKEKPPATAKGFKGLLNVGADGSENVINNTWIGVGGLGKETNIVFLHGNFLAGTGGNFSYSDVIYTGIVGTSAGFQYYADVVFMGDKAGLDVDKLDGSGLQVFNGGSLLYIGKNGGSVFWDKNAANVYVPSHYQGGLNGPVASNKSTIYHNTVFDCSVASADNFYGDGGKVFLTSNDTVNTTFKDIDANGPISDLGSSNIVNVSPADKLVAATATEIASVNTLMSKYNTTAMMDSAEYQLMTKDDAIEAYASVFPSTTTLIPASDLGVSKTFTAGNYSLNGGTLTGNWKFDLSSGKITLVIKGALTISTGQIRFTGGSKDNFGYIFLQDGVKLTIAVNWASSSGIISDTHDSLIWADNATDPKPSTKPFIYIIGFNNNTIEAYDAARLQYLEGYYGMYGANGTIRIGKMNVYGRYEATNLVGTSAMPYIPYCPAPWEESGGDTPITTKYEVDYYEYS